MKKGKRFGSRGFTVESNPGAVAALVDANDRLRDRVAAKRRARGQKPDHNGYISLEGETREKSS